VPTEIAYHLAMAISSQNTLCCLFALLSCCSGVNASSLARNATVRKASLTNAATSTSELFSFPLRPQSHSGMSSATTDSSGSTTTQGVGDFIAMGFGMSAHGQSSSVATTTSNNTISADTSPSSRSSVLHLSSQTFDVSTATGVRQNGSTTQAPPLVQVDTAASSLNRVTNSSGDQSGYYPMQLASTPPEGFNRSLTLSGDCWNQWDQYWSAQDWSTQTWTYWTSQSWRTETSIVVPENQWMSTSTIWSFVTTTVSNGRFPITTYSTTAPQPVYVWFTGTPTKTWTDTRTEGMNYASVSTGSIASLQSPSCVLPSIVPQCQKSWDWWVNEQTVSHEDAWAAPEPSNCNPSATTMIPSSCREILSSWSSVESAGHSYFEKSFYPPKCSQASVASEYCSSKLSIFLHNGERRGYYFSDNPETTTIANGTLETVFRWPSETTIGGPGCTLGCGNCAMQGETVELIYWPPATSIMNATAHGSPVLPLTVETLGTTFTSPTVGRAHGNANSISSTNLTSSLGLYLFRHALGEE